jgi:HAD superfamily hydrolase (TIGR01509 family)
VPAARNDASTDDGALPDAILFDMDGTLIDSEGQWLRAERKVMLAIGGTWTEEDQAACLGGPLERAVAYMIGKSAGRHDHEAVGSMLLDEMEASFRESPLVWQPGARDLLIAARTQGIPTALVSASWNRLIDAVSGKITDDLGVRAFDVVVAGDDVAQSKPHPEAYLKAAADLGAVPGRCLALEDSPTGVASAVAAGCRVIAIPHIAPITSPGSTVIASLVGWSISALWGATSA